MASLRSLFRNITDQQLELSSCLVLFLSPALFAVLLLTVGPGPASIGLIATMIVAVLLAGWAYSARCARYTWNVAKWAQDSSAQNIHPADRHQNVVVSAEIIRAGNSPHL